LACLPPIFSAGDDFAISCIAAEARAGRRGAGCLERQNLRGDVRRALVVPQPNRFQPARSQDKFVIAADVRIVPWLALPVGAAAPFAGRQEARVAEELRTPIGIIAQRKVAE